MMTRFWFVGAWCAALTLSGAVLAIACGDDDPHVDHVVDAGGTSSSGADGAANNDGSTPGEVDVDRGGTRLKVQGFETPDGLFVPSADPFDSQLNVTCSFRHMEDGSIRCAPRSAATAVLYSDAQCQNRIVLVEKGKPCIPPPQYVADPVGTGAAACDFRAAYFKVVGQPLTLTTRYAKTPAGGCDGSPTDLTTEEYFSLQKVPDTDFVAGKIVDVKVSGSIAVSAFEGEDGSRIRRGFTNVAKNKPCQMQLASDGKTRCVPWTETSLGLYRTDTTCATKLALGFNCAVPGEPEDDTAVIQYGDREECGILYKTTFFTRGAKRISDDYYTPNEQDGGCNGPRQSGSLATFDVGAEIAATTLPEVQRASPVPGQRIAIETAYVTDGQKVTDKIVALKDTRDNVPCELTKATDGSMRCLPLSISSLFYADPLCKVPLGNDAEGCIVPKHIAHFDPETCTTKMYVAGPKRPLSEPYFQKVGSGCQEVSGSSAKNLYTVGPEAPPDTFVEGKEVKR